MPSRSRRKPWLHLPHDHGEPLKRPRYDVVAGALAVFLGMFVGIGVPPQTHATVFHLPVNNGLGDPFAPLDRDHPVHLLTATADGQILWDNDPITMAGLYQRARVLSAEEQLPALVFEPEGLASFEFVARIMTVLVEAGATSGNFCLRGLRQYADTPSERGTARLMTTIFVPHDTRLEQTSPETMQGCEGAIG